MIEQDYSYLDGLDLHAPHPLLCMVKIAQLEILCTVTQAHLSELHTRSCDLTFACAFHARKKATLAVEVLLSSAESLLQPSGEEAVL